jgi:hypothetical protein
VDNTGNSNETLASLGLGDEVVPVNNRELLQGNTPIEGRTLLVELLLELLDTTLLDFVLAELLEVVCEAELLPEPDAPLGGIILVPLDGVAVIRGELMMEVVVTLAEGEESSEDVVTRRVAVIEGLVTEPVSDRVDAEGGLLDEADTEDTGIDETAEPVTPAKTSDEGREDKSHSNGALKEVLVLPNDNGILVQIGNIGAALALRVLLEDHPTEVGVEKALAD